MTCPQSVSEKMATVALPILPVTPEALPIRPVTPEALHIRPVPIDTPTTPHRLNIFAVLKKQQVDTLSPLSLRQETVNDFAKTIDHHFNVAEPTKVEKISKYESPEKWTISNDDWLERIEAGQLQLTEIAIRILLDTFLLKLGLRSRKWWKKRQEEPPTSTSPTVKLSTDKLLQFGFTDSEIDTLFTTGFRMELNGAAHVMKLKTMVSLLRSMKISQDYKGAIEKAFNFVCGFTLSEFDPKSNFVMNSTGISEVEGDLVLNTLFRKETPNESTNASTNASMNENTNENTNESTNETTNESTDESADKSPQQLL